MNGKYVSEEEFIDYYNVNWKANYVKDGIKHTDENYGEDYFRLQGEGMLARYYRDIYQNDDIAVLGVETDDTLTLPDGNTFYIRIDKLAYRDGVYYVCDYKTDQKPKEQAVADADQQLAMYAVWVRQRFPNAKDVKLVWHMLRFDGEQATVTSSRTPEQLKGLVDEIVALIKEIESATVFPIGENPHCKYCTYQSMCPKFVPPKALTIEDGVKPVDELAQKQADKRRLEHEIKDIQAELVKIAEPGQYDVISGTAYEAPIERYPAYDSDATDWDAFTAKVKEIGREEDYLGPNKNKVYWSVRKKSLQPELVECLDIHDTASVGRLKTKKNVEEE